VQRVTASADIAKGAVVTITPAAPSTAAACAEDGVGPFAVAIEAVANGKTGRVVTKGEVSVDCSGTVTPRRCDWKWRKVKVCDTDPSATGSSRLVG